MKNKLILLCVSIVFIGCTNQCMENANFKENFFNRLDKIIEYDNYASTGAVLATEYWMDFYNNTFYLHFLTGHQFRYLASEPPGYSSESDLKADIRDLKRWYRKNKCGMTIEKGDSIVKQNKDFEF